MERLISLLGLVTMVGLAWMMSSHRRRFSLRVVAGGLLLQFALALVILKTAPGEYVFQKIGEFFARLLDFVDAGSSFVFGEGFAEHAFAFKVLPTIIFFSSFMAVLYHLGMIQKVVSVFAWLMRRTLHTSGAETLAAAANVFVGQTEAPLVIRPYLKNITEPQLFAIMVSGVASIAGTVLAGYVLMGAEMKYLLAASFMAAPGGLLMAKMIMPDDPEAREAQHKEPLHTEHSKHANVILAAAVGAGDGLRLAVNIGAMLIVFVALIALFNGIVGGVAGLLGYEDVTMQKMLGVLFQPLMFVLSVPWDEAQAAGSLFGEKLILNEFVAFSNLDTFLEGASPRTVAIATFSLCGFANLSSIAILLGGIGSLVPEKKELIAKFGLRAVAAGSLANLMSAALAGLLLTF